MIALPATPRTARDDAPGQDPGRPPSDAPGNTLHLRRHDHPARPLDPYPAPGTRVAGLRYRSALVLVRPLGTVRLRTGEDADYVLGRDFAVAWRAPGREEGGEGEWRGVTVPAGLLTDLTSVPRPFRWFVDRVGPWLEAAILHDYLYIAWADVPGRGARTEDRRWADDMMLAAMREAGVGRVRAWAIHAAVRLFGGRAYARIEQDRYVDLQDPALRAQLAFAWPGG